VDGLRTLRPPDGAVLSRAGVTTGWSSGHFVRFLFGNALKSHGSALVDPGGGGGENTRLWNCASVLQLPSRWNRSERQTAAQF